ncbi:hypothetical protein NC652_009595 [Populus alba x Populus x berolinensis]|nr:hypothetical protein NC652_009595 [Populus alba x Populus x berolinensis]
MEKAGVLPSWPNSSVSVMLKQADGSYSCVAESVTRYTLGESATWEEEDVELETSSDWRS